MCVTARGVGLGLGGGAVAEALSVCPPPATAPPHRPTHHHPRCSAPPPPPAPQSHPYLFRSAGPFKAGREILRRQRGILSTARVPPRGVGPRRRLAPRNYSGAENRIFPGTAYRRFASRPRFLAESRTYLPESARGGVFSGHSQDFRKFRPLARCVLATRNAAPARDWQGEGYSPRSRRVPTCALAKAHAKQSPFSPTCARGLV